MTEEQIAELVQAELDVYQANGVELAVIREGVREDSGWWYVPVSRRPQAERIYQYYEDLTDIEEKLKQKHHLEVLLVPAA